MTTHSSAADAPHAMPAVAARIDLARYRQTDSEQTRTNDLLRLVPTGRRSVLDIGARDGHFSKLLAERFAEVTALDLERPTFTHPNVTTAAGDATQLAFEDNAFDCVFCAEVLEHIPNAAQACREIARVARHEVIIGVPFRQDTRLGRTTCQACGRIGPPWGHVNTFDRESLERLFPGWKVQATSWVGTNREATNPLAAWLMDLGGNPWGTYDQAEPCLHCGAALEPPRARSLRQRVCSAIAARMNRVQSRLTRPHGNWIHVVFSK